MRKGKYFLIIAICLIALYLIYSFFKPGVKISINNNTFKEISGLKIKSSALINDVKITNISKHGKYTIKLKLSKDFDESNMTMYYFDNKGSKHSIYLLGYFEKGYRGKIDVTLNSINTKGILSVNVKEHNNIFKKLF
ncbi:hypothetical protein KM800_07960 [Clostridium tyrobutyricum]|uniref:hypothetical protein n=1 Tax=Clostridium tyrobutyricum TaxID=1519 RepID=UPI001C38B000|nr:hypothetical protein [Clostridium tyrobutyricum]MBV4419266.1 hypothetical protein [Clostridium tyrobutyricum]